jgi:predicted GIY-YIG superfamily endonuclease
MQSAGGPIAENGYGYQHGWIGRKEWRPAGPKPQTPWQWFGLPPSGYGYVYKITAPNGLVYIGKTIGRVRGRIALHFSKKHNTKRGCVRLMAAINEFGEDSMITTVIGEYLIADLLEEEKRQIRKHNSVFPMGLNCYCGKLRK